MGLNTDGSQKPDTQVNHEAECLTLALGLRDLPASKQVQTLSHHRLP